MLDLQDALAVTYTSATTYTLYYDINNTPGNLVDDVVTAGGDADGSFNISGLAAGNYYIEVTDTNPPGFACVYSESFTIAGPSVGISANTQVTAVTCALNDGIIEVINPAGGWGGYTYFVGLGVQSRAYLPWKLPGFSPVYWDWPVEQEQGPIIRFGLQIPVDVNSNCRTST